MTGIAEWTLRISIGLTLLSAVADRFSLWGGPGTPNVSWGDWPHFVTYCGVVSGFLPTRWKDPLAWIATVLECLCAAGLLSGLFLRLATYLSAGLFTSFAIAMAISLGVKAPLNYSVFVDAAAALLLASVLQGPKVLESHPANRVAPGAVCRNPTQTASST